VIWEMYALQLLQIGFSHKDRTRTTNGEDQQLDIVKWVSVRHTVESFIQNKVKDNQSVPVTM